MKDFHRIRNFHDMPLTDADRAVVEELGVLERKRMIDDLHVPVDGFNAALDFVRKRHYPVRDAGHDTGKFHLMVGPYRSGKSWPVIHYTQEVNAARGDRNRHPVVHVTCADGWGAKQVFSAIVAQLNGTPPTTRYGLAMLTSQVVRLVELFKVELIVIDELNEIMDKANQGKLLMSNLREILDARLCNVLGVGEAGVHAAIKNGHAYVAGRGGLMTHHVSSPDWHSKEGRDDYLVFLDDVDERLPFGRKSGIAVPRYASHFYDLSGGSVGFTMSYVAAAAYLALDEGCDRIEHRHLVAMAVDARGDRDRFTHFVDDLPEALVARRGAKK